MNKLNFVLSLKMYVYNGTMGKIVTLKTKRVYVHPTDLQDECKMLREEFLTDNPEFKEMGCNFQVTFSGNM